MKFLSAFLIFLIFSTINVSVAYDSLDEFYNSIPIDKNDKNGLYLDYIENYKNDAPQKAVAISRNSLTKEINWDNYAWGIGFGYETIEGARKAALYECNYDLYPNEECIILIENNEVVLNKTKTDEGENKLINVSMVINCRTNNPDYSAESYAKNLAEQILYDSYSAAEMMTAYNRIPWINCTWGFKNPNASDKLKKNQLKHMGVYNNNANGIKVSLWIDSDNYGTKIYSSPK